MTEELVNFILLGNTLEMTLVIGVLITRLWTRFMKNSAIVIGPKIITFFYLDAACD